MPSIAGSKATLNRYRFSSKPIHESSGLYDYLYRWYLPELQRWPNRDPIEEAGGLNLYRFVRNNVTDLVDPFGQAVEPPQIPMPPAFPSKPFEAPPAGTGGTSGGNLAPAFPTINYPRCSEEGKPRQTALQQTRGTYNGGFCPCTNISRRCFDYERCEFVGTAGTRGTTGRLGWVPHTSCTKCPEGSYPPN